MLRSELQVSVVIACHTRKRLQLLLQAIESVRAQVPQPAAIVISVDHEPILFELLSESFPDLIVVENKFPQGASGNRNTGVSFTNTALVAFLDDDARARPGWLQGLIAPFADPNVVCTGGFVVPAWEARKPRWFPDEFAWVVGASHLGMPDAVASVRNVWSENMAVRRETFLAVGGFRLDFGKVGHVSRPEDTDLCIRMGRAFPDARLLFVPSAIIDHHVGRERADVSFFLRRCYSEGRGKIELARINAGKGELRDERDYLRVAIPNGLRNYVRRATLHRQVDDLCRAGAMVGGVGAAAVGASISLCRHWVRGKALGREMVET